MSGAELVLHLVDTWRVTFRDHSYRWIFMRRFELAAEASDRMDDLLVALLQHPANRHFYPWEVAGSWGFTTELFTGGFVHETLEDPPWHGPFRLEALSAASFESVPVGDAQVEFRDWLLSYDPLPPANEIEGDIGAVFAAFDGPLAVSRLRQLPPSALNRFADVADDWHEWVVLRPDRQAVLVMGGED